jgi:hypothetical protein
VLRGAVPRGDALQSFSAGFWVSCFMRRFLSGMKNASEENLTFFAKIF